MVVDDQYTSRTILETVLNTMGDNIIVDTYDNAISALNAAEQEPPDLVVADYKMPELDGVEFTRRLRAMPRCQDIPIVIVTVIEEKSVMYEALEAGATDFLTKPVDHYECKVRFRNLLSLRRQQLIIRNRANSLETQINAIMSTLHDREIDIFKRLARVADFNELQQFIHQQKIGRIAAIVASEIGMDPDFCNTIETAAPMYDIGKIGITGDILLKPASLTEKEMGVMRNHTKIGYEILRDSQSPYLQMAAIVALYHHEKYNGKGYPEGLHDEDIPIEARIVATVDMFDALISKRPYNKLWHVDDALDELSRQSGEHLDPVCVNALIAQIDVIVTKHDITAYNHH